TLRESDTDISLGDGRIRCQVPKVPDTPLRLTYLRRSLTSYGSQTPTCHPAAVAPTHRRESALRPAPESGTTQRSATPKPRALPRCRGVAPLAGPAGGAVASPAAFDFRPPRDRQGFKIGEGEHRHREFIQETQWPTSHRCRISDST